MGGFFFAFGLLLWTVWHDYKHKTLKEIAWTRWFLGSALGSIPLLPWAWVVLPQLGGYTRSVVGLLVPKFYIHWLTTALGVNLSNPLGKALWRDFLREPLIFSMPTYLMIPAHIFLLGIGLYPIYRFFKSRRNSYDQAASDMGSELNFYLKALGFVVGGIFTLTGVNV